MIRIVVFHWGDGRVLKYGSKGTVRKGWSFFLGLFFFFLAFFFCRFSWFSLGKTLLSLHFGRIFCNFPSVFVGFS